MFSRSPDHVSNYQLVICLGYPFSILGSNELSTVYPPNLLLLRHFFSQWKVMFSDLISWSLSWLFPLCYQPPNLSILIPKYFLNLSTNLYSMATTMGQMPIVSHVDNWNSSLAIFSFSRPSLTEISQWKSCHYATIDLCVTIWTMPFLVVQLVNNLPEMRETWVWSLGWDPLEKGKGTHSRILAWRSPWIVKSMGSQRVGHDWLSLSI